MPRLKRKLLDQRKELIERYIRAVMYRKAVKLGRGFARKFSRYRLQWTDRNRQQALASTLKIVAFNAARAQKNGFEALTTVLNLGLFFLIAERDIQSVKIDALTHPDPWKRSLSARIILLSIHELDINKVAGIKLRQALQDGNVPEELCAEISEAMSKIRKAQSKAQRQFARLRNSTIAHRDSNAIQQYRDIIKIDELHVAGIAAEFYEGTQHFIEVLPRLTAYLGTWSGLIAQISAQSARNGSKSASSELLEGR